MTQLARLYIQSLRNIDEADLSPGPAVNILFGDNGSGKTSVLEAIYMLGTGRSFRSHLQRPLIQEGQNTCAIHGELQQGLALGVQRNRHGGQTIKIGGLVADSIAQLSHTLPLMLFNGDSFAILEGGPSDRRRFLDWGVFHVKHEFQYHWKTTRLALKQRNQLLKQEGSLAELDPWSQTLAKHGELINKFREEYLQLLAGYLQPLLTALMDDALSKEFSMSYERGWQAEGCLLDELSENLAKDRKSGHTSAGPHRAEINFRIGRQDVANHLSRGQMKLLISALKLAQIHLLEASTQNTCLLLIDDLPAELDVKSLGKICSQLSTLKLQVFLACIDPEPLTRLLQSSPEPGLQKRMFHVKRGRIEAQV